MVNARMSKKAGRRKGLLENKGEIDVLEKILDGGVDNAFYTDNPYRYVSDIIDVQMPERPNFNISNNLESYAQKFPMVATKTRMDKLKQQGIDEIDKRMQEAIDKIPAVEGLIRVKALNAKDEWNEMF